MLATSVGAGPASAASNAVVPGTATCPQVSDAYSSAVLADSPIAYYRLDETSGTTMCDSSSSANNGTYNASGLTYGAAGALASSSDTAISADGTSSGLVGQSNSDPTGLTGNHGFTLEAWFKNAEHSTNNGEPNPYNNHVLAAIGLPCSNGGQFCSGSAFSPSPGGVAALTLYPNHNAQLARGPTSCFGIDQNSGDYCWDASTVMSNLWDGNWHYLAVTYDASAKTFTGYVDGHDLGAPVADQYGNPAVNIASAPIRLGQWADGSYSPSTHGYFYPLIGSLDEATVYPAALSSARIEAHWTAALGLPGAPTIGTATGGNASASVSFSPPSSTGGSAITSYTVTSTDTTNSAH
ncbi:MAG: LamG-like jellyroll fold domain-containing protein, partial [Acidimicrobiales bacterium]